MKNIFSLFVRGMALCVAMASCTVIEKGYVTPPLAICDYSAQEMFFESDHHIYEIISGGGYDVGLGSLKGDFFMRKWKICPVTKHVSMSSWRKTIPARRDTLTLDFSAARMWI